MSQSYDAVIIGAGIMGCSSAFELAHRGMKVAVLDKGVVGGVSTGRSSAIIRQHYSNELTARMALYGVQVFRDFEAVVGGDCGFRQTGFVAMAPAKDRAGLEANVALQQSIGINTEVLSPEALRDVIRGLDTAELVTAAYEPDSGYADPHLTVSGYVEAAKRLGAEFFPDTEVTSIRFAAGRVVGVGATPGSFDAPVVVNCAGAWGAQVAEMAGFIVPIDSCRVQVAFFERPPEYSADHPVVVDFMHASYFRSETGNLSLVGLIDPSEADAVVDPDDYQEHIDNEFIADVGERWMRRWPAMESSKSRRGYAGLYAVTPDWHPIVDELPVETGCFICAGFSGHGFKLGPAVGVMVADMVTKEPNPRFPHDLFRFHRFVENELVRGQYAYSITG